MDIFYKGAKKKFDSDAEFKKKAQLNVVDLQAGDELTYKSWKAICDISLYEYAKLYKRLSITITDRGESFYNPMLAGVVKELEEKGIV